MANPEIEKAQSGLERTIRDEIDAALGAFRASGFEGRVRARIGAAEARPGRPRRPARSRALAWAGAGLVALSAVSIGVWMRSRVPRGGTALSAIEAALAKSPYLRPGAAEASTGPAIHPPLPGSLREAIETELGPARSAPRISPAQERVSPPLRPVAPAELDRRIGELLKGRKLELFFSEYMKYEEDV